MAMRTHPIPLRLHLHFDPLIQLARDHFECLDDPRRCPSISLPDALMAGFAMFSLKDPSLLAFQRRTLDHNLKTVFGLQSIPSDTQFRPILDAVDPADVRPVVEQIFTRREERKVLDDYRILGGHYSIALDGVEYFSSKSIHCDNCSNSR